MMSPFLIFIRSFKSGKMVKKSLFGLLGKNLNYSLSPSIFNHYFRKMKIEALYVPLSIPSEFIPELLEKIKQSSFVGLNVTMPYKEKVIPYLDQINEDALKIGAINVIHNLNGKLRGYNTDYTGFIKVLKKHDSLKLESALVLGAGGAARSIIFSLYQLNFRKIVFFTRREENRIKLLQKFFYVPFLIGNEWNPLKINKEASQADIIINATPVGMFPAVEQTPLDIVFPLKRNCLALDLIYNPPFTEFLKRAKAKGALIENGLNMLIYQALNSAKIWMGQNIEEQTFLDVSKEVLNASFSHRR